MPSRRDQNAKVGTGGLPSERGNGRSVTSKGADPDTLVASAKAYLGALNKLIARRQRGALDGLAARERRIHSTEVG